MRISDPARTVVDILDNPALGGGVRHGAEILDAFLNEHPHDALVEYGDRLGNRAVFKRLGYLLEELALNQPRLITEARSRISTGIALLEPSAPVSGPRIPRWGIRANARITKDDPS